MIPEYPRKTTDLPQVTDKLYQSGVKHLFPHFREIDEPFIRSQLGDVSLTLFILIKDE
jgi:hypothetical protein